MFVFDAVLLKCMWLWNKLNIFEIRFWDFRWSFWSITHFSVNLHDFYDSQEIMDLEEISEMDLNPIDQGNGPRQSCKRLFYIVLLLDFQNPNYHYNHQTRTNKIMLRKMRVSKESILKNRLYFSLFTAHFGVYENC